MNKIPAFRSFVRLDTTLMKNSCRLLSYRLETATANPSSENAAEELSQTEEPTSQEIAIATTSSPRYNVCPPRIKPLEKIMNFSEQLQTQNRQNVRAAIEEQHLQPAMLKEYYKKSTYRNLLINPNPEPSEEHKVSTNVGSCNKFQVSKTYANAILPLKNVKLANPFPEPVKSMMSHTVSDSEKAQQALAESKSASKFADWTKHPSQVPSRTYFAAARRFYSKSVGRDPEKCKKVGGGKKGCPKMNVAGCPAPARVKCDRQAKQINCKKQLSPYPAYSEFCHEDIDEKPSSCKICPWTTEENPNFKPPKKQFHTSVFPLGFERSGLEGGTEDCLPEQQEGMLCDMRKGQCERPKNRVCPPSKEEVRKKKEEARKKKDKKKKCDAVVNSEALTCEDLDVTEVDALLMKQQKEVNQDHIPEWRKPPPKPAKPCRTPKFKFPKCDPPKKTGQFHGRCPPKKKKPLVEDCPPCGRCSLSGIETLETLENEVEGYQMKKNEVKKDRSKCPKVDMTVFREEEDDDPCRLKRKGTTKICPADLLKRKKRKPKKPVQKHSEIVPPKPKVEPPRPTSRIM